MANVVWHDLVFFPLAGKKRAVCWEKRYEHTTQRMRNRLFFHSWIVIVNNYYLFWYKFELQVILIHCDLTRARTNACNLPAKDINKNWDFILHRCVKYLLYQNFIVLFQETKIFQRRSKALLLWGENERFWRVEKAADSAHWWCLGSGPSHQWNHPTPSCKSASMWIYKSH